LTGQLTLGPNLKSLQQMAQVAFETGSPDALIVEVGGVRYTDSAGLGELTILYSLCMRKQCMLILAGVPNQLRQMLELTRLDALLPSASDTEAAKRMVKAREQKQKDLEGTRDSDEP
jgi:anti-anti-sigma factor